MRKIVFIISLILLVTSCNATKSLNEKWVGKSKQDVVLAEGPPTDKKSDENGGEILIYEKRSSTKKYEYYENSTKGYYKDGLELVSTYYYINAEGKVYNILVKSEPITK